MAKGWRQALLMVVSVAPLWGQRAAGPVAAFGSVSGRVLCSDTNRPARMAHVVLLPIVDTNPVAVKARRDAPGAEREPPTLLVETQIDGSFSFAEVRPGEYYVLAEQAGYLTPLAQITREDLNHPTETTARLIAKLLTPVSVAANRTSTAEIRLLKGAVIAGTVRYDDGSPDVDTGLQLLQKDAKGRWQGFRSNLIAGGYGSQRTDDQGHYRISGLPAGEYLVRTRLELTDTYVDHIFANGGSTSSNTRYSMDVYFGDTERQSAAKVVKVGDGEEAGMTDVTIPVSRLHPVSGSVVEGEGGRLVNAGRVALLYPDDGTELVSTEVRKEDTQFHFAYVPEGEYTLRVSHAKEVTRDEVSNGPGSLPPTHTVEKTLRTFGSAEQPLVVHGDVTGVQVGVKPVATK